MQRIIQINIAGRVLPVEEDAYLILKDYIQALERQFAGEEGREEIIQDIEGRIAELFSIRLMSGTPSIDQSDVRKVMEKLGMPHDLNTNYINPNVPTRYVAQQQQQQHYNGARPEYADNRRLYRSPSDKMIGGVCGGLGHYFDVDPVILRLLFAGTFLLAGVGLLVYLVAWAVIPLARTPEALGQMANGQPMNIHDFARNMSSELQDLKHRGEAMSRELRDFFSKKK